MKDLYKRLGIQANASLEERKRAVARTEEVSDRFDASAVLFNEHRKRIYDHHRSTVQSVATIRALAGISTSEFWNETTYGDFIVQKTPPFGTTQGRSTHYGAQSSSNRDPWWQDVLSRLAGFGILVLVLWLFSLLGKCGDDNTNTANYEEPSYEQSAPATDATYGYEYDTPAEDYTAIEEPQFNEPELPLPRNGKVWSEYGNRIAPLRITVPDYGNHYYVKLLRGDNVILAVFIHSGRTVNVNMPLGTYEMKYAYGTTWYGLDHLFGPETVYNLAEDQFEFYREGSYVQGVRVELILQQYGNLSTTTIPADQF